MNQLFEVSAGIVNQKAGISASADQREQRASTGPRDQAQTAYRPANGHASGRPSDASTSIANASRGRLDRWQSIAARHSVTIIGSELAIRTRCE